MLRVLIHRRGKPERLFLGDPVRRSHRHYPMLAQRERAEGVPEGAQAASARLGRLGEEMRRLIRDGAEGATIQRRHWTGVPYRGR